MPGDTVNCMLGAANRDPSVFSDPNHYDPTRPDVSRQLGFATGVHFCLGSHLARLEAQIAIGRLFARLTEFHVADALHTEVRGYEFRQPNRLIAKWQSAR